MMVSGDALEIRTAPSTTAAVGIEGGAEVVAPNTDNSMVATASPSVIKLIELASTVSDPDVTEAEKIPDSAVVPANRATVAMPDESVEITPDDGSNSPAVVAN